jgi:hypothetical protein
VTLEEFRSLVDVWGADRNRWPGDLRLASAAIAETAQAVAILAESRRLDTLILAARPNISQERVARAMFEVTAIVSRAAAPRGGRIAFGKMFGIPWWSVPAASFVCAGILGVCLGLAKPLDTFHNRTQGTALTMILDGGPLDPGWVLQ